MSSALVENETDCPLCVDLDGTLIATDLLWESLFVMLRARPWDALRVPIWLLKGRAHLKARLAEHGAPDVEVLPYRAEVIEFLRARKAEGRRIVLTTAAQESLARRLAEHLALFDEVIASDGTHNLKGRNKLEILTGRFAGGFDYVGDSHADIPLLASARRAYLVRTGGRVYRRASTACDRLEVFEGRGRLLRDVVKAMRPHQWAKNLLLFVPLVMAHRYLDLPALLLTVLAFVAFCLAASGVYLLNDLLDLQVDRRHVRKRHRPLAAGRVPIPLGVALSFGLLATSLALALALPMRFVALLGLYLVVTTAYSAYLKTQLMIDVITLAGLYTLRILAGGAATMIPVSPWLMAFAMFFFLSMAFAKRYTELAAKKDESGDIAGRGYRPTDLDLIRSVGPVSGYLCVMVLCLYINSPEVRALHRHPGALWYICPLLLYWISRVWFLAYREELPDDPVVFALRDKISYLTGSAVAIVLLVSF
jgi:4-hydroxybenzoate polyprenyltransferase/phosphoserine phosphatase